jgi:hypothetical protein
LWGPGQSFNENERDEPENCRTHAQRYQDPVVKNNVSSEFHRSDLAIHVQLAVDNPFAIFLFTARVHCKLAANRGERVSIPILCISRHFPLREFVGIHKSAARVRVAGRTSSTSVAIRPKVSDRILGSVSVFSLVCSLLKFSMSAH